MTTVIFETATIADAIKKADRVAPNKGMAFDKAAGILIEVNPGEEPPITLRATNQDIFYREWVDALSVEGEARVWRLPSKLLTAIVSSLPIGNGKTVTFKEETKGHQTHLVLKSGNTKAKLHLMTTDLYPDWDIFDPDELFPVADLGGRISQVEWAASKDTEPLTGIFFDGEQAVCTDKYRIARTPAKIGDVGEAGIIVPAGILGSILKQTGEVQVGFTDHQLLIMPNETTQLRVVRLGGNFPNMSRFMAREHPNQVTINKSEFLDVVRRTLTMAGSDRLPTLRLFFGKERIAAMIEDPDQGYVGDILDVPGQADHDVTEIKFTPKNLTEALDKAPSDKVTLGYDINTPGAIMYLSDGSGYECWVFTRAGTS